ncbi:RNA 2',3'-cyclic phosphodiesterase [Bacillus sp. 2205SS5-2]|uniref:RNA 2',3'-cyclic phosphodiesterase n=1 Tax=Bacillus sp. 2205SS5-2 TaxID=3109031 RepID=UPI003003CE2A
MNEHYFLALPLTSSLKQEIHWWTAKIQRDWPFLQWVHPQDYHLTLIFLGKATSKQLESICQKLKEVPYDRFKIQIHEIGTFGNEEKPRILWAGVEDNPVLCSLQAYVYTVCKQEGIPLEARQFTPHITLARKWGGENVFSLNEIQNDFVFTMKKSPMVVENIVLYRTHMNQSPKYEAIQRFPLNR